MSGGPFPAVEPAEPAAAPSSATLVITIALNGYEFVYRDCIRSQQTYCRRHHYRHHAVVRPRWRYRATEAAWLKLVLLLDAMSLGYQRVAFIDADAELAVNAPPLDVAMTGDASVYMAKGHSGRFNSGVIFAVNDTRAREFFAAVLRAADQIVPAEDRAPYENGHVIHIARQYSGIAVLPQAWNNTADPTLDPEYVRHYTGPMRGAFRGGRWSRILKRVGPMLTRPPRTLATDAPVSARIRLLAADYRPRLPALVRDGR